MDETTATVLLGCRLAGDLETNLLNIANQPEILWRTCNEIVRVFSNVKERILASYPQMGFGNIQKDQPHTSEEMEGLMLGVQMRSTHQAPAMDLLREHESSRLGEMVLEMSGGGPEVGRGLRAHEVVALPPMRLSGSGGASSSAPRQRTRKNEEERRRAIVAAPGMGNKGISHEDGYTWKKYGQKHILKSRFPRSYFKCNSQKQYNCPAKKQVQRLNNDPTVFEVIYRGVHTCNLSSTAPSIPPPSTQLHQETTPQATNIHPPPPSYSATPSITSCLPVDIMRALGQVTSAAIDFSMQMPGGQAAVGTSTSGVGGGGGPSTSRYMEDQLVAYMADAMFNSGSSSNTSMDLIFSSNREKWDSGERKN